MPVSIPCPSDDRDAADRAAYETTGNPLYAWFAVGRYGADEPLPLWVRRYLLECTRQLVRLQLDGSVSPTEAAQRTAQALGLVDGTRNRFTERRQVREDSFVATLYGLGARKGATDAWALELAEATGARPGAKVADKIRHVRRVVARARRIWPR